MNIEEDLKNHTAGRISHLIARPERSGSSLNTHRNPSGYRAAGFLRRLRPKKRPSRTTAAETPLIVAITVLVKKGCGGAVRE